MGKKSRAFALVLPFVFCGVIVSHATSQRWHRRLHAHNNYYQTSGNITGAITARTSEATVPNSLSTIIDDMSLPFEGQLEGVPSSFSWSHSPTAEHLDQLPMSVKGRFHALEAWGAAYAAVPGNPATNVRVQVRNLKTYVLTNNGQWHLVQQDSIVTGGAFLEDFYMNISQPIRLRREPDGGVSAKMIPGYVFHFFAPQRIPFDPAYTLGVYTTYQARLIVDNHNLPDDRSKARILAGAGCDAYESLTSQMIGHAEPHVGIGRYKFVTDKWQSFNMISLTKAQIDKYPPPIQ